MVYRFNYAPNLPQSLEVNNIIQHSSLQHIYYGSVACGTAMELILCQKYYVSFQFCCQHSVFSSTVSHQFSVPHSTEPSVFSSTVSHQFSAPPPQLNCQPSVFMSAVSFLIQPSAFSPAPLFHCQHSVFMSAVSFHPRAGSLWKVLGIRSGPQSMLYRIIMLLYGGVVTE